MGEIVKDKVRLVLPKKVREVASAKLQGWAEEDHEATRLISDEAAKRRGCGSLTPWS